MSYKILWLKSALRELNEVPAKTAVRVAEAVGRLASEPRPSGCKELKGYKKL